MHDTHFDYAAFRHLLEKDNDEEQIRLLLHHLAMCPGCAAGNGYVLELYRAGALAPRFSTVELDLARSRAEAPALWQKLLAASSFEERKRLLRDADGFRSWGLCELLCAESERAAARDAGQAVERAELAVLLSSLLEEWQPAEELWLHQLRSLAWAHLGNARRVLGELRSAGEAFDRSDEWWEAASSMGDVLGYEVRLLDLKSSLRRAQRRLDEALDLLERALEADACGASKARLLIKKAKIVEEQGDLRHALDILTTGSIPWPGRPGASWNRSALSRPCSPAGSPARLPKPGSRRRRLRSCGTSCGAIRSANRRSSSRRNPLSTAGASASCSVTKARSMLPRHRERLASSPNWPS